MSSRRVHGRHPLLPSGGAALDHEAPDAATAEALAAGWRSRAGDGADLVTWVQGRHVTLALPSLPEHRDHAAAWLDALVEGAPLPAPPPTDPALRACLDRAALAGRPWFVDEHGLTLGVGRRSTTWRWRELPFAADHPLTGKHAPVVLVSGTNGKTTTAVLLGAIAWADGWLPGVATSSGIRVGREWEVRGDWSGAEAARRVMRHDDVNFAILETARGGILRRGVLVEGAHCAILTNVSADHLGESGVDTLDDLAAVKVTLARALAPGGTVVVRAGDQPLARALAAVCRHRPDLRVLRFSAEQPADGWWDGQRLVLPGGLELPADEVPLTLGGRAPWNVENALAAALAALACGIGPDAVRAGLRAVQPTPEDSPGRANLFAARGAAVLLEYAHNPDALRRLRTLSSGWPARRRGVLLGQAGDRPRELILALAAEAAALSADHYVLKPLPGYARGRAPEEVVAWLREGLLAAGVPAARIGEAPSEQAGVEHLLAWAEPGDLVLMLVHEDADAAVAAIRAAGVSSARP